MGAQPSSAALFQAMTMTLRGVTNVQIYCDDLIVHNNGYENHLKSLDGVLGCVRDYGMRISPRKCKLAFTRLSIFGFDVSGEGICPSEDKLAHMRTLEYPTTNMEVRSFLGFMNFFHAFIPNFALYSSRLSGLT
ncbi:MAG: hypothetical protein CXT75_12095 [Methanobacteriota archaeon]|nr:MAG: hypothetical protein CXT75_12095 [Euryarchaeota archaeon]